MKTLFSNNNLDCKILAEVIINDVSLYLIDDAEEFQVVTEGRIIFKTASEDEAFKEFNYQVQRLTSALLEDVKEALK